MSLENQISLFKSLYNVSRETIDKLSVYERLIVKNQRIFSLVGKSTLNSIWLRHFADSAKIVEIIKDIYSASSKNYLEFVDVGSGAGFPGVVVDIMAKTQNVNIKTVLVDSNKRKCAFLDTVKKELNLSFKILNIRSESIERHFDIISTRAVTSIKNFLDINHKMIDFHSNLIFLKGKTWPEEIKESKKKWNYEFNVVKNNKLLDSSGGVTLIITNLKK